MHTFYFKESNHLNTIDRVAYLSTSAVIVQWFVVQRRELQLFINYECIVHQFVVQNFASHFAAHTEH